MTSYDNLQILDCTIRDGGYLNNWNFSDEFVKDCYESAYESGFDYFEIGFRSAHEDFGDNFGKWTFSEEQDISSIIDPQKANVCKIAVMSKVDNKNINITHFRPKKESLITMVRVLLPYIDGKLDPSLVRKAVTLSDQLIDYGYEVTINLACIDKYKESEMEYICNAIGKLKLKYLYFADTYGATDYKLLEERVNSAVKYLRNHGSNIKIGLHFHNNLLDAYPRTIRAIELGSAIVDSCMAGLGRGAGNLNSEILLGHLYKETHKPFFPSKYNIYPALRFIDKHLRSYKDKYPSNLNWGYNILYVLSGFMSCHPNYAAELIEKTEKLDINTIESLYSELLKSGKYLNYDKTFIKKFLQ